MAFLEDTTTVRPDGGEFARLTDPFRRELFGYAYRMLGSIPDAEDAVQETYLRGWQSYDRFAGRSSLRTWLYRIATNVCLRAIERSGRRPLPSGLGGPADPPGGSYRSVPADDVPWLQPVPDTMVVPASADTASVVAARSSVRLAFVAALQHLPARQRAVLILRDVLAWPAADVARMLDTTVASATSALQRARAQLAQVRPVEDDIVEPSDPDRRAQLERYVTAFQDADLDTLIRLLRHDVVWEMPPLPQWYAGRDAVGGFLAAAAVLGGPGSWRTDRTAANGGPALAMYARRPDRRHHAHGIQLLDVTAHGIARVVTFLDPGLFPRFGLPSVR
jgi:RNA polymerase sigma-70 factor (ECF subfamily)